jgi:hypothetical protein
MLARYDTSVRVANLAWAGYNWGDGDGRVILAFPDQFGYCERNNAHEAYVDRRGR